MPNCYAIAALAGLLAGLPALGEEAEQPTLIRASGLSDQQKLEKADQHIDQMKRAVKQLLTRLEDARSEKDIARLNCLNERLTQAKGLLRVAEQADIALQEAVARKEESTEAEYTRISIAKAKTDQLRAEAEECVGQLAFVVDQKTTVQVEQPELPEGDVTRGQPPPPPVVRSPAASPFQ